MRRWTLVGLLILTALPCPARSCTLCLANLRQMPTLRLEANQSYAQIVMYGRILDSALDGRVLGKGTSKFRIDAIFKKNPKLPKAFQFKVGDVVALNRYIPVANKKDPPHYLVFCDVLENSLDPYRGTPVVSEKAAEYLQRVLSFKKNERFKMLRFFFDRLESDDPQLAQDAFLEFAKASDAEVGLIATKLNEEDKGKLRTWLTDEKTPPERIGLYCFLLGATGGVKDAKFLRSMLDKPDERARKAFDGILSGYIQMRPDEGWKLVHQSLGSGKVSLPLRLAIHRVLKFYHGWQPKKSKPKVLQALKLMITQGELADLAIEDLRQWEWWELTDEVLKRFGSKGFDAPIIKRAIIRYALTCDNSTSQQFIKSLSASEREIVAEVKEGLQFEKSSKSNR